MSHDFCCILKQIKPQLKLKRQQEKEKTEKAKKIVHKTHVAATRQLKLSAVQNVGTNSSSSSILCSLQLLPSSSCLCKFAYFCCSHFRLLLILFLHLLLLFVSWFPSSHNLQQNVCLSIHLLRVLLVGFFMQFFLFIFPADFFDVSDSPFWPTSHSCALCFQSLTSWILIV